jgi:hypothetical protein
MKKIKYLVLTLGVIMGFGMAALPIAVDAASTDVFESACDSDPDSVLCKNKNDNLTGSVQTIVNTLLFILGAVSVFVIIIGGVSYVVSMGDAKKIETAKNTIMYAVIGLVVAILASAIVNFVVVRIM